jgi:hypothetical protein
MTAFDTSSNTGSATYTNAYNTVELLPSAGVQKAAGFVRTSGWRYFEWHIDDQGGDNSRLFIGAGVPPAMIGLGPNYLHGGTSKQAAVVGGIFDPPGPAYVGPETYSLTACTGDVFMFALDLSGQGRDHAGVVRSGTLSDGMGNPLIPFVAEVGKNGAWQGTAFLGFAWPAHGYPMRSVPWAARDSTSAASAKVSLKVRSASFAYPIPAGMTAYGDGPEGALIPGDDFTLAWDPAVLVFGSLSDSNRHCIFTEPAGQSVTSGLVMSLNLFGLTGKRYMEMWNTPPGVTPSGFPTLAETGLYDGSSLTNTFGDATEGGTALIFKDFNTGWRRGVNVSTSLTCAQLTPFNNSNLGMNVCGWMIDFDNKLAWFCQPEAGSGSAPGIPWMGNHSLSASVTVNLGVTPYSWGTKSSVKGIPLSITAATSVLRVGIKNRIGAAGDVTKFYINGGQFPFITYPLLPGARSMNGGRMITAGQGDSWDVVNNPASATYGAAGVSINKMLYSGAAQCAQVKSSGKKYFELHFESDRNIAGMYVGLRREAATTMTTASEANRIDQALVVKCLSNGGARWRYGVNIGSWTATMSPAGGGTSQIAQWHGVAVDFDRGEMWVGQWNYNDRVMKWGAASDPATGLNPHLTFTASTSLRIFVSDGGSTVRRINLVQDDLNVVGLPSGFVTWGGTAPTSVTATPSPSPSASLAGAKNVWPTGVMT